MAADTDDIRSGAQSRIPGPTQTLVGQSLPSSNDNTAAEPAEAPEPVPPGRSTARNRRRGPLITRWIGFAARRQRAQERTNRLARD